MNLDDVQQLSKKPLFPQGFYELFFTVKKLRRGLLPELAVVTHAGW